jgi:hypothetical protein
MLRVLFYPQHPTPDTLERWIYPRHPTPNTRQSFSDQFRQPLAPFLTCGRDVGDDGFS